MSDAPPERLYHLLPTLYRMRDEEQGGSLRALLAIMERQLVAIEQDIERLGEDWFIETCQPWLIPYIADLLGVRGFSSSGLEGFSPRAFVANTIAYRRRKGTVAVLERLAHDVTGWPAHAAEFFQRLSVTQNVNHVRLHSPATVWIRDAARLEFLEGPFDSAPHTIEVRRIASGRGRYNVPNVGLFVWRLGSYPVTRGDARPVAGAGPGRFTFDPLGHDVPLFNEQRTEARPTHLSSEDDVPGPVRRRDLHDELERYRQALADGEPEPPVPDHFGNRAAFRVFADGKEVPPEKILICDLRVWVDPPGSIAYVSASGNTTHPKVRLAVDPGRGRIAFRPARTPSRVQVSYAYGFSADVGGGPYDRRASLPPSIERAEWRLRVSKEIPPNPGKIVSTLRTAIDAWNETPRSTKGLIAILDSRTYKEHLTGSSEASPLIKLREGCELSVVGAKAPLPATPANAGASPPDTGPISPAEVRPVLLGDVNVKGLLPTKGLDPGILRLNGLWIEGNLTVDAGNLQRLEVTHCTLAPPDSCLTVKSSSRAKMSNESLVIRLEDSIGGPIVLPSTVRKLEVRRCILDARSGSAVEAPEALVDIQDSTVLGSVRANILKTGNSIIMGTAQAVRRQEGCMRFCYVPPVGSKTPRRYRCQPDLGLAHVSPGSADDSGARFRPSFTSTQHGEPGYAQLGPACPIEIRTGAEDGSEMGVFRSLKQPLREASLRLRLSEYLPTGMEAGLIHVT